VLDDPILFAALICFALGLVLSGVARIVPGSALASLTLAVVFLAGYVLTYQQVPSFPPVGATNKIFYVALAAALVGFALDLRRRGAEYGKLFVVVLPLFIVGWIGYPRFISPDVEVIVTSLGLSAGGIAVLWCLYKVSTETPERDGGSVVGTAMLIALLVVFAPVALLGSSSTSLMLCLVVAAGLAACAFWELAIPRQAFCASAVFGVGCGLLAVIDTVTLITQQVDLVALALVFLVPYAGLFGARFLLPANRVHGRLRQILIGTFSAAPILPVLAVLFLRHPQSFTS
jgi:hypothetical protein